MGIANDNPCLALENLIPDLYLEQKSNMGKVKDIAQLLEVLESDKVQDAAQLEVVLAMDNVDDLAQLWAVLQLDQVQDLAQIIRLLSHPRILNLYFLEQLLLADPQVDAAALEARLP